MEADTSTLSNGTFEGRTGAFRAMLRRFPLSILWLIVLDGPEFSVRETEEQAQRHVLFRFLQTAHITAVA
jgi:hypothetical protein